MRTVIAATAIVVCLAFASATVAQTYQAAIDGSQEVPANASTATGFGTFSLNAAKMLSFSITFSGLLGTETGAHIHGPAAAGANAGVIFPLPAGSPKNGMVGPLTPTQEAQLNGALWYVNIHSTMWPGGEIRGQILTTVPTEDTTWGAVKAMYNTN